jgi:hypothetical protein
MQVTIKVSPSRTHEHTDYKQHLPFVITGVRAADLETAITDILALHPQSVPTSILPVLYPAVADLAELPEAMPTVMGLFGDPGSGKDVVAEYLQARYRAVSRYTFSDAIRQEVNAFLAHFSYGGWHHHIVEGNKSHPPYRHLLQAWGQARRSENPNYWLPGVERAIAHDLESGSRLVIASGARDPNEIDLIYHDYKGLLLRVVSPHNTYRADHEVERQLQQLSDTLFVTIVNDYDRATQTPAQGLIALAQRIEEFLLAL